MYIAGHTGLVGSALLRRFSGRSGVEILTATRAELDLTRQEAVERFLSWHRPEMIVIAAGRVGGIRVNAAEPAAFMWENLLIQTHIIHAAWKAGVKRLLNFGSACMYPRECPQPMRPEQLMTGPLEPTNHPYAVAKLAGWTLCEAYNRQYGTDFVTAIPAAVYGPGDSFDADRAHVIPALMRKMDRAKARGEASLTLWGSGRPKREFLYVDDLAQACELIMNQKGLGGVWNIGPGRSHSIAEIAQAISEAVGYTGSIQWDSSQPDGAPEKRLEVQAIGRLGWSARTPLKAGIEQTYRWFKAQGFSLVLEKESSCISS